MHSTEPHEPSEPSGAAYREPSAPMTMTRPITPTTGMTVVEYLILLVLIAAVSVGIWKTFGEGGAAGTSHRRQPAPLQAGKGAPDSMPRSIA